MEYTLCTTVDNTLRYTMCSTQCVLLWTILCGTLCAAHSVYYCGQYFEVDSADYNVSASGIILRSLMGTIFGVIVCVLR